MRRDALAEARRRDGCRRRRHEDEVRIARVCERRQGAGVHVLVLLLEERADAAARAAALLRHLHGNMIE